MIIAFTGHRPEKLGGYAIPNPTYDRVMKLLDESLLRHRPSRVIVGMALGVDQWAAELCLFNQIPITAAIPFEGFDSSWPAESRQKLAALRFQASQPPNLVRVIADPGVAAWKYQRRNEWMVEHSDLLVAIFDGTPGGTANCVRYAQEKRKRVEILSPQMPEAPRTLERPALTPSPLVTSPAQGFRTVLGGVSRRINRGESEGTRAMREAALRQMTEEVAEARRRAIREEEERQMAVVRSAREAQEERAREERERSEQRTREFQDLIGAVINSPDAPTNPRRRRPSTPEPEVVEEKEEPRDTLAVGRVLDLDL